MAISMPKISKCDVTDCSYNTDRKCHTLAITIGDSSCPMCDTFLQAEDKGGDIEVLGGVGACKSSECTFNSAFECSAGSISVGEHSDHADCLTYKPR